MTLRLLLPQAALCAQLGWRFCDLSLASPETCHFSLHSQVAFEVRAPEAGVVKSVAVEAGQTVGVGAPIMVLDTDGKASASATAPSPAPAAAAPKPAAAAPAPAPAPVAAADSHSRVPSIRFRHGNRGAINAEIGLSGAAGSSSAKPASKAAAPKAAPAPVFTGSYAEQVAKAFPSKAGSKTYLDLPPAFGRPRISEAEARAIESGGAY